MGKSVDLIQVFGSGKLDKPEVRVWCHPRRVGNQVMTITCCLAVR